MTKVLVRGGGEKVRVREKDVMAETEVKMI